ncbi:hypothetical protein LPW11_16365 [Geomonas sp. RF6]|uniref:hypothetical protein n=1 Tax=Geomonas sp. RF6 TaxID=2897342 RepID=UPI001E5CD80C|nr:hypothetical protein [Geomonas sp. RF6]UFS69462.1 hypothetical protein LPW11_16365 [Geomonas sp. RF6]
MPETLALIPAYMDPILPAPLLCTEGTLGGASLVRPAGMPETLTLIPAYMGPVLPPFVVTEGTLGGGSLP